MCLFGNCEGCYTHIYTCSPDCDRPDHKGRQNHKFKCDVEIFICENCWEEIKKEARE